MQGSPGRTETASDHGSVAWEEASVDGARPSTAQAQAQAHEEFQGGFKPATPLLRNSSSSHTNKVWVRPGGPRRALDETRARSFRAG